jgi:hypothetical protein
MGMTAKLPAKATANPGKAVRELAAKKEREI